MNQILNRETIAKDIKQILSDFDDKCRLLTFKKGIYNIIRQITEKSIFPHQYQDKRYIFSIDPANRIFLHIFYNYNYFTKKSFGIDISRTIILF